MVNYVRFGFILLDKNNSNITTRIQYTPTKVPPITQNVPALPPNMAHLTQQLITESLNASLLHCNRFQEVTMRDKVVKIMTNKME